MKICEKSESVRNDERKKPSARRLMRQIDDYFINYFITVSIFGDGRTLPFRVCNGSAQLPGSPTSESLGRSLLEFSAAPAIPFKAMVVMHT